MLSSSQPTNPYLLHTPMVVILNLGPARWIPIASMRRGRRFDYIYLYGTSPRHCYLICHGLRDYDLVGYAAEVSVELDEGGPVITVYQRVELAEGAPKPTRLSRLLWPEGDSNV